MQKQQATEEKKILRAKVKVVETSEQLVPATDTDASFFRHLEQKNIRLNEEQIAAVRHGQGPCLTLASAGTGKTTVLVCRTAYLVEQLNITPDNILLLTFTRKAADEMKERIGKMFTYGPQIANRIIASTFHAFCLQILRSRGLARQIISNDRQKEIVIKKTMRQLKMKDYEAEEVLSLYTYYRLQGKTLRTIPKETKVQQEQHQLFAAYQQWKEMNDFVDFDDILCETYDLLESDTQLLAVLQQRFQYIMVDEFQDTNIIQYSIIQLLAGEQENLFVVGDDDQTIYSFQGAKSDIILSFDKIFKQTQTVTLKTNYRSTDTILGLANEVIKHNVRRKEKELVGIRTAEVKPRVVMPPSSDEEAKWIIEQINEKVNDETNRIGYGDIAILYRTASSARAISEELTLRRIPFHHYVSGSKLFYDHYVIAPIVAMMHYVQTPNDLRLIEPFLATFYVNKEDGMQFLMRTQTASPINEPLLHLKNYPNFKPFQSTQVVERVNLLKRIAKATPSAFISEIRQHFYDKFVETQEEKHVTMQKETLKEMLVEFETSAKRFQTIADFLHFIATYRQTQEVNKSAKGEIVDGKVHLMTIHRAKGLEWPVVYLIGANDNNLPHTSAQKAEVLKDVKFSEETISDREQAIEEERRLLYVAITRAKEELYISAPKYYQGNLVEPSRFILQAYGKKMKKQAHVPTGPTVKVRALVCTTNGCKGFQRVERTVPKETVRQCPICEGIMRMGTKEISLN